MSDEKNLTQQVLNFEPIATYTSKKRFTYDAGRQSREDSEDEGEIQFVSGYNFEQALEDLAGFERIWVLFIFDRNSTWSQKVFPPRGTDTKKSVFATRSPYRPNPIGLSCVRLIEVHGRTLKVKGADLLNGTPILDIKPYLSYADAFPESKMGWLEGIDSKKFKIEFTQNALNKLELLRELGFEAIRDFTIQQLEFEPLDNKRKRVVLNSDTHATLAYRTFRIQFNVNASNLQVFDITSGYTEEELLSAEDPYQDKLAHRVLVAASERG